MTDVTSPAQGRIFKSTEPEIDMQQLAKIKSLGHSIIEKLTTYFKDELIFVSSVVVNLSIDIVGLA